MEIRTLNCIPSQRPRYRRSLPSQRGSALVMALSAVAVVMILMLGFVQLATSVTTGQTRRVQRKRAFYTAEAGLAESYTAIQLGRSGRVGTKEEPAIFGDGLFWVEVTEDPDTGLLTLKSTGMVAGGKVELSLVAERGVQNVAALGTFSNDPVSLPPGSFVDSYNSSDGPYDPATATAKARVASNGQIDINGTATAPTTIRGSVMPGFGATSVVTGDVQITGTQTPALAVTELPEVDVPAMTQETGVLYSRATPLVYPGGRLALTFLELAPNTQAVVSGPAVLVLDRLTVQPGAELTFDTTTGPIELYVKDELVLASGSTLLTPGVSPRSLAIQIPTTATGEVRLDASSQFYGVLYAPGATVTVGQGFEVFGSLVGGLVQYGGPATLHFDEHLADLTYESSLPLLVSWRILSLGSNDSNINQDPFTILGVDKLTLDAPYKSYEDQWLDIKYVDTSSVTRSYSGLESGFDWTQVQSVISASYDGTTVTDTNPSTSTKKYRAVF